jgi:hypothetical protein
MTPEKFAEITENFTEGMLVLLNMKAEEYSRDGDRLYNFKIAGALKQETPEKALWGMIAKQIVSIKDMCEDPENVTEKQLQDRTLDVANYMALLQGLIRERHHDFNPAIVDVVATPAPKTRTVAIDEPAE